MISPNANAGSQPNDFEMEVYQKANELFEAVVAKNTQLYETFEKSKDPAERIALAKKIQALEETVVYNLAQDFNLTLDEIAQIYCKVDTFLNKSP